VKDVFGIHLIRAIQLPDAGVASPPTDVDALGMDDTATTAVLGEAEGEPPGR